METIYDRMARGVGVSYGHNPVLSNAGRASAAPNLGPLTYGTSAYQRPAPVKPNPVSSLATEYKKLLKASNDANEARDLRGSQLLGMESGDEWRRQGFATPDAYERHKAFATAPTVAPMPVPQPMDVTGAAKAAVGNSRANAIDRGIHNTSTALNRENAAALRAAQEANAVNYGQQMQAYQAAEATRRYDTEVADRRLGRQLDWLDSRDDIPPNMDRLAQIASTEGEGNTEGMAYPMAGGGGGGGSGGYGVPAYGGAANTGYMVPTNTGFSTPQRGGAMTQEQWEARQRAIADKEANRQASYRASRGEQAPIPMRAANTGRLPVAPAPAPIPVDYGNQVWRRSTVGLMRPGERVPNFVRPPFAPMAPIPRIANLSPFSRSPIYGG